MLRLFAIEGQNKKTFVALAVSWLVFGVADVASAKISKPKPFTAKADDRGVCLDDKRAIPNFVDACVSAIGSGDAQHKLCKCVAETFYVTALGDGNCRYADLGKSYFEGFLRKQPIREDCGDVDKFLAKADAGDPKVCPDKQRATQEFETRCLGVIELTAFDQGKSNDHADEAGRSFCSCISHNFNAWKLPDEQCHLYWTSGELHEFMSEPSIKAKCGPIPG